MATALIIEDGSVVAGANSYVSVADVDNYHSARGNSSWTGTTAQKEAAIIQATTFIDGRYGQKFLGVRTHMLQPRQWPRHGVAATGFFNSLTEFKDDIINGSLPYNKIPQAIKDATCEAALRALTGPLFQDRPRGGRVKRKKTDVVETEYFANAPSHTVYEIIDAILNDYIRNGINCKLVRV